jgi:hypothetical protein
VVRARYVTLVGSRARDPMAMQGIVHVHYLFSYWFNKVDFMLAAAAAASAAGATGTYGGNPIVQPGVMGGVGRYLA